jgi:hypothetical protein
MIRIRVPRGVRSTRRRISSSYSRTQPCVAMRPIDQRVFVPWMP